MSRWQMFDAIEFDCDAHRHRQRHRQLHLKTSNKIGNEEYIMITEIRCVNHFKCTFKQTICLFSIENQKTNANRRHNQLAVRMFVSFFRSYFDWIIIQWFVFGVFVFIGTSTSVLDIWRRQFWWQHFGFSLLLMPSARPVSFECE